MIEPVGSTTSSIQGKTLDDFILGESGYDEKA